MIVIALIIVVASLAIPVSLRSRVQSNEAAAIGNLRTISSASESYRTTQNPPAYPANFDAMMTANPAYLDSAWTSSQRQGYVYTYTAAADGETFSVTANPRIVNVSGNNAYCVDQTGVIRRFTSGAAVATDRGCDTSGAPI